MGDLVGSAPAMTALRRTIRHVAAAPTTVLVRGESGVGKELVARALHALSPRAAGPFVAVNCAALTETILESELFGYERGAFSGALQRKPGLFEAAHGGTILLDEVGEMSPSTQAKLLRVLQERTFHRVGGVTPVHVDVRVVASTNRDLERAVAAGTFRADLYYRLNVVQLDVPPLRERRDDIPLLAHAFLDGFARTLGRRFEGFAPGVLEALAAHWWPGNVRELRNAIERAAVLAHGPRIQRHDVRLLPAPVVDAPPPAAPAGGGVEAEVDAEAEAQRERTLADVERAHIARVLEQCHGNKTRAAQRLGIHRTTLAKKLREYGLADDEVEDAGVVAQQA